MSRKQSRLNELKARAFSPRNELSRLVENGGELSKSAKPTITPKELAHLMDELGKNHQRYFKYIKLSRLPGLLKSRCLYLSRLSQLNDLDECLNTPDASRIYVGSLRFGSLESMGMWKLYGNEAEAIRLEFPGKVVQKCLAKGKPVYEVEDKGGVPSSERGKVIPEEEIEHWSLHDVLYKYGQALMWNHQVVGFGRCPELKEVFKVPELVTYVKTFAWSDENEVRVVVKLRNERPDLKWLAMDFDAAIARMKILTGPVQSKQMKVMRKYVEAGLPLPAPEDVSESTYHVDIWD